MHSPVTSLVLACYVVAQCAVSVRARGCFDPHYNRLADVGMSCALQFFATGMQGKNVSLAIFDPDQGTLKTDDAPFDEEKAVIEFSAPLHLGPVSATGRATCLHLEKIQVTFNAPYNIDSIDTLVLDSFEGKFPPTQEPLGQCFTIEQREVRRRGWQQEIVSSVYGTVYTDLWCVTVYGRSGRRDAPEQISFEQRPGDPKRPPLQSGC